ncbi:MAG: hypothetical protein JXR76_17470 [Deltaproteobacteria bacterium]|nr:hypothetical protein [Deltaproteobacteria bacterium]
MLLMIGLLWMGCDDATTDFDELIPGGDTGTGTAKPANNSTEDTLDVSSDSQSPVGETETDPVGEETETHSIGETETDPVGDSETELNTTRLTNGYGQLFPGNGMGGVSINIGASFTTTVSRDVKCVSRETLIAFLNTNVDMFTPAQYEQILNHYSYINPGYEAELLLGMLGIQLANDFNWFFDKNDIDITSTTSQGEAFLNALNGLVEIEYRMSGPVTAVALSAVPVSPVFFVRVAKLNFVNGVTVRAINTHVFVADENGSQSRVRGQDGEAPLTLTALQ